MEINCSGCRIYLGTITKAKLRKNTSFLCNKCESLRYKNHKPEGYNIDPSGDIFGDMFGDLFKGNKR